LVIGLVNIARLFKLIVIQGVTALKLKDITFKFIDDLYKTKYIDERHVFAKSLAEGSPCSVFPLGKKLASQDHLLGGEVMEFLL